MGCTSSKLFRKDFRQEIALGNGDCPTNHVVSLTSTTYGVLKIDRDQQQAVMTMEGKKKSPPREEEAEVINTWELMEDLEEEAAPISVQPKKKSPKSKSRVFLRGFADLDARSPLKLLNQMASPKKLKRFGGKENKLCHFNGFDSSPKRTLNASPNRKFSLKGSVTEGKCDNSRVDSGILSKRSVGHLFGPKLERSFEKKLSDEEAEEEIKQMVSAATPITRGARNSRDSCVSILNLYEKKCPPGSENSVVIYTTTLRGIRKTFEDCNTVRSIMESHHIQMFERDVSMDSGFREELRRLMGAKEVKVPVVFVKGRLIGGADEVVKLDEEGKLGILFDHIPRVVGACVGCAGIRFVVCVDCSGSCKVLDENGRKTAKCGECNENGLIQCPICC